MNFHEKEKICAIALEQSRLPGGALAAQWSSPLPAERKARPAFYRFGARARSLLRRMRLRLEGWLWGRDRV